MDFHIFKKHLLFLLFSCCLSTALFSQKMTIVKGTVIDADTKEPLLLVNIAFVGTTIGTTTDLDGSYVLESKWASDSIQVSYLGYESQTLPVVLGARQEINVALSSSSIKIATVEVKAKKGRYRRKDNPAVELMRNVIDRKNENRLEAADYYEYDKYEKIQFDFNNFDPEKLSKKKVLKKFKFMLEYVDTSDLNGKPFLPFFIQEASSKVYYRKDPEGKKEYRNGVKVTGMEEYIDNEDLTTMTEVMYQKINIYDDNIRLLDLPFMSPLSPLAIGYYRFYIIDSTGVVNGIPVTTVSFMPVNNQNIAFKGELYITRDSSFAVVKADLSLTRQANVNFVQDLRLEQVFSNTSGVWALSKDKIVIDFAVLKRGLGVYGTRDVTYMDYVLNEKRDEHVYAGTENIIDAEDAYKKDDSFWLTARPDTLTAQEQGIYEMIDTLQKVPTFRTLVDVGALLFTGYKDVGPIDIGPIGNFYSFNPVEGFRLKVGGETNLKFHPKLNFAAYTAYGFKDEEFKYGVSAMYSFREDFKTNPKHYFKFAYQHDVNLVGQILQFSSADNFFLSFQRGSRDKMFFIDKYLGEYFYEGRNNLSVKLNYLNSKQRPVGGLYLAYDVPGTEDLTDTLSGLTTSEFEAQIRFAPNEQYVQGRNYRVPIYNRYPVFTLKLSAGLKDVLGGDYNYQKASLGIFKRFYLSLFGTMKVETEFGKIWGTGVPYFLLYLPRANQSYAYRSGAFNMMNYQEFVADEYAWIMMEHFLNGFIFNKVPLFRKLKLREVLTFKAIYGRLTDKNDPSREGATGLIKFIEEGEPGQEKPITYTLEDKPYIEASVGVANIFKFFRVDVLRRFTHLDHPEVPHMFGVKGMGLRVKMSFEF